jgi:hypothetical protein
MTGDGGEVGEAVGVGVGGRVGEGDGVGVGVGGSVGEGDGVSVGGAGVGEGGCVKVGGWSVAVGGGGVSVGTCIGVTVGQGASVSVSVGGIVALGGGVVTAAMTVGEGVSVPMREPAGPMSNTIHSRMSRMAQRITTTFFFLYASSGIGNALVITCLAESRLLLVRSTRRARISARWALLASPEAVQG